MRRAVVGALAALALTALPACKSDTPKQATGTTVTTSAPATGSVRIGVWMPPDPSLNTYGGAATRTLVYPQLFRATPSGTWQAGVVEPGSDQTAPDRLSATFRFRANAKWSDGQVIAASDLRRTIDPRFVTAVDDATPGGTVAIHFAQALPGWRRLWSGLDAISPPRADVYGGPYQVVSNTPNLETVLKVNPSYYGTKPRIAEVHLVLVPDGEIGARLMEKKQLDVYAPLAFTNRTQRFRSLANATVLANDARGGWTVSLVANPAHLSKDQRASLFGLVTRDRFVDVLLHGEAVVNGATPATSATSPVTTAIPAIASPLEAAPTSQLLHAMQRLGRTKGITFELRPGQFDQILGADAAGEYDMVMRVHPPSIGTCWVCEAASVDPSLAQAADAGTPGAAAQLLARLATEAQVFPLWRERPVVAVRKGLRGVSANGFAVTGPAWNLETWSWAT